MRPSVLIVLFTFAVVARAQVNNVGNAVIDAYNQGVQLRLQRERQQQEAAFQQQLLEIERRKADAQIEANRQAQKQTIRAASPITELPNFSVGNGLMVGCAMRDDSFALRCGGYVAGIVDGLGASLKACFPVGVTENQVSLVIVKYLREHPEQLHRPSAALVPEALIAAFPCA